MTTKKIVAFASASSKEADILTPSTEAESGESGKPKWRDLILKDNHKALAGKLEKGPNWLRVLPGLKCEDGSVSNPFIAFLIAYFPGGRFALSKGWGAVGKIYNALKAANRVEEFKGCGLSFPADNMGFLAIRKGHNEDRLGFYCGSSNDGSHGGQLGWTKHLVDVEKPVENPEPGAAPEITHVTDQLLGVRVNVEKTVPDSINGKKQYPSYRVIPGRQPAPIVEVMEEAKIGMESLVPVSDLINYPSEEEQWEILEKAGIPKEILDLGKAYVWEK